MRLFHFGLAAFAVACALAGAAPARAFGVCSDGAYMRGFDPRLVSTTCETIVSTSVNWSGGRAPLRVLKDASTPGSGIDYLITPMRNLADRISRGMNAMGGLSLVQTTIFLTDLVDADARAAATLIGGECQVVFYVPRAGVNYDELMFVLAHEMFHCITAVSIRRAYGHNSAKWWAEGSAEYFAHLVYGGTGYSDADVGDFDAGSPTRPLWQFTYSSVPFFFWLGQTLGPAGVSNFVHGMSTAEGPAAELAALRRQITPARWRQFGQAYLDRRITQPGGRRMASTPRSGETARFTGSATRRVTSEPFILHRELFVFARGKQYELIQNEIAPGVTVDFSRDEGAWQRPPSVVPACRQEVRYRVLATTTERDGRAVYEIKHRPERDPCCLVGLWQATPDNLARPPEYMNSRMPSSGQFSTSSEYVSGSFGVAFRADLTGATISQALRYRTTARIREETMVVDGDITGELRFTWSLPDANKIELVSQGANWMMNTTTRTRLGTSTERRAGPNVPVGARSRVGYACSARELVIDANSPHDAMRPGRYTKTAETAP